MSSARSLSLLVATIFAIIPPLLNGAILEKISYVVLENPNYPTDLGLPGPPQISGGATAVAPAAAATQDTPATPAPLAIPMMTVAPPEITASPPLGSAGCTPLTQCRLYYQVSSAPLKTYTAVLIDHSSFMCITGPKTHTILLVLQQTIKSIQSVLTYQTCMFLGSHTLTMTICSLLTVKVPASTSFSPRSRPMMGAIKSVKVFLG